MMMFALINQSAPNIRKTVQSLERLRKKIRELVVVEKKVYNKRETEEQKEEVGKGRGLKRENNERESRKEAWPRPWNNNRHNIDKT